MNLSRLALHCEAPPPPPFSLVPKVKIQMFSIWEPVPLPHSFTTLGSS